jgi:hypothetical protein
MATLRSVAERAMPTFGSAGATFTTTLMAVLIAVQYRERRALALLPAGVALMIPSVTVGAAAAGFPVIWIPNALSAVMVSAALAWWAMRIWQR